MTMLETLLKTYLTPLKRHYKIFMFISYAQKLKAIFPFFFLFKINE